MDIEGQEAIKRSLSNAATEKRRLAKKCKQEEDVRKPDLSLVLDSVHRSTFLPRAFQSWRSGESRSCLRYSEAVWRQIRCNWPMGSEFVPTGAKWNWNHCSHKLVNADKCLVNVSEKIPSSTHHRSVRTSTALTVIWIDLPCLFPLNVTETLHTLSNFVIISLFYKKVSRVAVVKMFCRICIFVAWKVRSGVVLFVIARPEEEAQAEYLPMQRVTTWSEHAKHHILTSDFDATLISETHLRKEGLLSAVTEAKKSGWAGTSSAATNTARVQACSHWSENVGFPSPCQSAVTMLVFSVQTHGWQGGSYASWAGRFCCSQRISSTRSVSAATPMPI